MTLSTPVGTIDLRTDGDRVVVALSGEVDIQSRDHLQAAVDYAGGHLVRDVEVDMTESWFIDCSVLTMLARLSRASWPYGRRVAVVGARPSIRKLIELGGLSSVVDVRPTA